MKDFRFIASTPPGLADPSIAIAASRAGGIGVLDLEYKCDERTALAAISKIARYARNNCGIKLDSSAEKFLIHAKSDLPEQIQLIILTAADPGRLGQEVRSLRRFNLKILLEVTCLEHAQLGEKIGVDGLIAKGHEAGGWVGEETTFVLLQRLLGSTALPVWAHGGIGLHTVAACYTAGAAGVVLDSQFLLMRESHISEPAKASIARMDGSETVCLGGEFGAACRIYNRPGLGVVETLRRKSEALEEDPRPREEVQASWRQAVKDQVGWGSPDRNVWLLGQDAAFAASFAQRFHTVGAALEGIRQAIADHIRSARRLKPLNEGAPLAVSHHTRYPIVQGPMTRVSDKAAFALKVAQAGGLPFLALALMRASEVEALLKETADLLGDRSWGVGILGFVPFDLRQEQLDVIKSYRPPFALIAGGRPDQARSLEMEGIPTYLHVPSPGLLKTFLDSSARRFVFEGRECGGHVGPRSSFVLWNTMIDVLLESLPDDELARCHVLFAGGIHDARSGAMVSTLAAPLAERGARIGVLLGTAYLFSDEAVSTGAIVKGFQEEALRCDHTVLLETGPGHSTRCVGTPYAETFKREKRRFLKEAKPAEEIRNALEELNLGRLRMASKGIVHNPLDEKDPGAPRFLPVSEAEQSLEGMYMIGQLAALRSRICTIQELHQEVSVEGSERLAEFQEVEPTRVSAARERPSDIAIIGMACLLPKANDLKTYWENILNKVDAINEIPADRWDWRLYFDPDPKARDKVYSKWGGFLDEVPFDPMRYGIPPAALSSIDPVQLLTLEVVRAVLEDAGYTDRDFDREHTSVILGVGGGIGDLGQQYVFRSALPRYIDGVHPDRIAGLPEWTEDSFPGLLSNVVAGRVANRFNLGGVNYTVDAACASSLAAVYLAAGELEAGASDMVIVGGADTVQNPFAYLCFSKTHALSPRGKCRTFDESADGIVISEGIGILVLKRLADAERDGDRIYAVIKAVAGSSDGRAKGLTAPRPEGQILSLERAYAKAGFSPATVDLIEAHGTGTVAGDRAEVETLKRVFEATGATPERTAIGSVKSMIGHTKCAAGVASLMKVALALHHKILPPTINVEKPNPILAGSPFYVNTEPRPWIHVDAGHPRRAGVSSFGFGGTNFHAVLEEYTGEFLEADQEASLQNWPGEIMLWAGASREEIAGTIGSLEQALERGETPKLADLAYTLWQLAKDRLSGDGRSILRLAIIANSLPDLRQKLASAREMLANGEETVQDPRGIYFAENPLAYEGKVAFLFPGQGSQYVDMLRELALYFPEVRERFEIADGVLSDRLNSPLSKYIFPPPRFNLEEERARQGALTETNVTQPALGAASLGVFRLLEALGVRPEMVAGHSYGEYVALCVAGVFDEEALYSLSEARGRCIIDSAGEELGTMVAVAGGRQDVAQLLESLEGVWIANSNAPEQTVISGTRLAVEQAIQRLKSRGIQAHPITVACAFHSPLIARARDRLALLLAAQEFASPELEVFSNTLAARYPLNPREIKEILAQHLVQPVDFMGEVMAMYEAGARIFVEVGPRHTLTGLVEKILAGKNHLAVSSDFPGRSGILQLLHLLGLLAAHGVGVQLDRLFKGRTVQRLDLGALHKEAQEKLPPTAWLISGGQARPLAEVKTVKEASMSTREGQPEIRQISSATAYAEKTMETVSQKLSFQSEGDTAQVMLQYQRLMNRFVETQKEVMLAYLHGTSLSESPTAGQKAIPIAPEAIRSPKSSLPAAPHKESSARPADGESSPAQAPAPPVSLSEDQPVSSGAGIDREKLTKQLLQIVSERTGYPPEMLDLDLNMEADLGIDSIKRVEILGAFQRVYFQFDHHKGQEIMEKLTGVKTLGGIIDAAHTSLQGFLEDSGKVPSEPAERDAGPGSERADSLVEVPRFVLTAAEKPISPETSGLTTSNGAFIITDDERGVAQAVADELRHRGAQAVLVKARKTLAEVNEETYTADLTDFTSVTELLNRIQQKVPIRGIIHLLPLKLGRPYKEMDLAEWRARLQLEVKSLYYLAKAGAPGLKGAGESWLVAATAMGGAFASDGLTPESFFPGHGGIAGLVKTVAVEWPEVRCKVIDFDPQDSATILTGQLLREMESGDEEVEVGYKGARRFALRPSPAPLNGRNGSNLVMDPGWVLLVTGGARGITAQAALELATRYRPTFLLVGRSSLPQTEESAETAGLAAPAALKASLMDQMRREGEPITPSRVEAAYNRLQREREMRKNLAAMRQAGAKVHYYQVDVRDEKAFGDLVDEVYRSHGRLDGVIHGAGIIEDKLIEDKTPESFDRVFDTKVDSVFILSRRLRFESLKFLLFFSSVAGCFGNRGQCDYAAANEVLNKLAIYLDRRWSERIVSINWGPWGGIGMANAEVQERFARRSIQVISPAEGSRLSLREILYGRKGEVEVVLGNGPWAADREGCPNALGPARIGDPIRADLPDEREGLVKPDEAE